MDSNFGGSADGACGASGAPPPTLNLFPLTRPSTRFTQTSNPLPSNRHGGAIDARTCGSRARAFKASVTPGNDQTKWSLPHQLTPYWTPTDALRPTSRAPPPRNHPTTSTSVPTMDNHLELHYDGDANHRPRSDKAGDTHGAPKVDKNREARIAPPTTTGSRAGPPKIAASRRTEQTLALAGDYQPERDTMEWRIYRRGRRRMRRH